jgi:hypothetical protein
MKKEFILAIVITLSFLGLGFFLLEKELIGYGVSFFVFLPFSLGFILGKSTLKNLSLVGLILSLIIFLILLLAGGLEGMICILMALPLIIAAVGFGILIKYLYRKSSKRNTESNTLKLSIVPFLLFITFGVVEHKLTENETRVVSIESEITLPYTPMEVYNVIKSVDTLDVEKTFLMKIDLPVPQKCVLEAEEIGAIRTCYFDGGKIVQQVTELKKGELMKMKVLEYQLTGRKWLGFKDAIYRFEKVGENNCKMTRITTYTSELYPRFYWQPLEQIGIEQEHDYVFRNIIKDLKSKHGG